MKKFLYTFVIATLILLFAPEVLATEGVYYTNSYNIEMTEQEYNNLLSLGFTEKQIDRMDSETFSENKDLEATLVSQVTKYYKTTTTTNYGVQTSETVELEKDEFNRQLQQARATRTIYNGQVETTYKLMTTTMSQLSTASFRYKVDLDWQQIPSTRSHDIIAIGFEPAKVALNSLINFRQDYTYSSGTTDYSLVGITKEGTNGCSATIKLPSGSLSELSSYLYFTVRKAYSDVTVTSHIASGDYAHATSSVSESAAQNYTVDHAGGINLGSSIYNKYDEINIAQATYYGSW